MTDQFGEIEQVELALKAAERMVGQATMSMDEDQLMNAQNAISDAKAQLEQAKLLKLNPYDIQQASSRLNTFSHQVDEAIK
ncbi:DUF2564 family protein [Salipaludibacillus sp. CF4.18]|uniref:DUF2564 family protein n=1 Tax=Salipaludibacillus sp. CF4.18 TaxID=3373081 RepID=UPI003EE43C63